MMQIVSAFNDTLPPPFWSKPVYELDAADPSNNGYQNQDLIVWMRTAALPTFRKFYRRVNHTGQFSDGLLAGNYTLRVSYGWFYFQAERRGGGVKKIQNIQMIFFIRTTGVVEFGIIPTHRVA